MKDYSAVLAESVLRHRAWFAEHCARIETELAGKVKSEFIATVSHELRTPLNTIRVTLPVRIKFDELPAHAMPRSSSARFSEMWQKSVGDEGFLDSIVDRWRNASAAAADAVQGATLFAESVNLPPHPVEAMLPLPPAFEDRRAGARESPPERREFGTLRREPNAAGAQPTQAGTAVRAIREKLHHR